MMNETNCQVVVASAAVVVVVAGFASAFAVVEIEVETFAVVVVAAAVAGLTIFLIEHWESSIAADFVEVAVAAVAAAGQTAAA